MFNVLVYVFSSVSASLFQRLAFSLPAIRRFSQIDDAKVLLSHCGSRILVAETQENFSGAVKMVKVKMVKIEN